MKVKALISLLLLAGCSPTAETISVWPGMSVGEFNRLNRDKGHQLRTDDTDWIGVNSPVVVQMRYKGEIIEIPSAARGGGLQIVSGGGEMFGTPMQVRSLSFDVGPTHMSAEDAVALIAGLCDELHLLAGTRNAPGSVFVPSVSELVDGLAHSKGFLRENRCMRRRKRRPRVSDHGQSGSRGRFFNGGARWLSRAAVRSGDAPNLLGSVGSRNVPSPCCRNDSRSPEIVKAKINLFPSDPGWLIPGNTS